MTTELGDAILHDLPPPYPTNERDTALDVLDRLVRAANSEARMGNTENALDARTLMREFERVKNFILFVLAIDYKSDINVTLSSADRKHFTDLCNVLSDIDKWSTDHDRPSLEQSRAAAPYFSRFLHQPCRALNIPTEYMAVLLSRFVKYQNALGRYSGCCKGLIRNNGLDVLACKLVTDRDIVIPRVAQGLARCLLKVKLEAKMAEFFTRVRGIEGAIWWMDDRSAFRWEECQSVSYVTNERGRAIAEEQKECAVTARRQLSVEQWMTKMNDAVSEMRRRWQAARADSEGRALRLGQRPLAQPATSADVSAPAPVSKTARPSTATRPPSTSHSTLEARPRQPSGANLRRSLFGRAPRPAPGTTPLQSQTQEIAEARTGRALLCRHNQQQGPPSNRDTRGLERCPQPHTAQTPSSRLDENLRRHANGMSLADAHEHRWW